MASCTLCVQRYNFYLNYANFLEYNPKNYIIFWNIIQKFVLFYGIAVYVNMLCLPFANCEHSNAVQRYKNIWIYAIFFAYL